MKKNVIMSSSTEALDLVHIRLIELHIDSYYISGKTTNSDREGILNKFNNSRDTIKILLLSEECGAVGMSFNIFKIITIFIWIFCI